MVVRSTASSGNSSNTYEKFSESVANFGAHLKAMFKWMVQKTEENSIKVEKFDSTELDLKGGTVYIYDGNSGLSSLTVRFPKDTDFISSVIFSTTSASGSSASTPIKVSFPATAQFVGVAKPVFYPNEKWELNIMNGIVACSKIV